MKRLSGVLFIVALLLAGCGSQSLPASDLSTFSNTSGIAGSESLPASQTAGETTASEPLTTEEPPPPLDPTPGKVNFVGELFGEPLDENFYNYCPSVMNEGDRTMHVYYCTNSVSGNVTDYVAYRKGTPHADGKWTFTEASLVLSPGSDSAWDSRHVCDPSVVKGRFSYGGETYSYLMAYLGCKTDNSTANEIGLAFAKSPEGPWMKFDKNPIANFYASPEYNAANLGYGQPSLVSMDRAGKVFLFYTKGISTGTFTQAELWDFSDADHPVKSKTAALPNFEVALNNADFAYDPKGNRFYCVKEDHKPGEWYPTDGGVKWISGSVSVLEIKSIGSADVRNGIFGNVTYTKKGTVDSTVSGYARNHNAALVTDEYGWITDRTALPMIYTVSALADDYPAWNLNGQWPALHTYRLHGYVLFL